MLKTALTGSILVALVCSGGLAAAKTPHPVVKYLGTRAPHPSGSGGECFNVAISNPTKKPMVSINIAIYAYDKAGKQIGAKYEKEYMSLGQHVAAGGELKDCIAATKWFAGEVATIEAVVYQASFDDNSSWSVDVPDAKKKGAAIKDY
jgi:hypothetical protein